MFQARVLKQSFTGHRCLFCIFIYLRRGKMLFDLQVQMARAEVKRVSWKHSRAAFISGHVLVSSDITPKQAFRHAA